MRAQILAESASHQITKITASDVAIALNQVARHRHVIFTEQTYPPEGELNASGL
jgi:hypothetical protein